MPLFVVSTPIGNPLDIGLRAIEVLKSAEVVIGEEFKEASKLLRQLEIPKKTLETLNEHTPPGDIKRLVQFCEKQSVVLVSDCGTPGFCDPGAELVAACRRLKIPVHVVPGASSLMCLLSASGVRTDQFLFRGFLPANTEERQQAWLELKSIKYPIVIMDTPYRLQKTMQDLQTHFPKRQITLGLNLTAEDEAILSGTPEMVTKNILVKKAEFVLLLH